MRLFFVDKYKHSVIIWKEKIMKTKKIYVKVELEVPARMKSVRAAELIEKCIEIGIYDAEETIDDGDLENEDANDAISLNVLSVK